MMLQWKKEALEAVIDKALDDNADLMKKIEFKSFVVFSSFGPWHQGLVVFLHDISVEGHQSPFPFQNLIQPS